MPALRIPAVLLPLVDFYALCARCNTEEWTRARTVGGAVRKRTVECGCRGGA